MRFEFVHDNETDEFLKDSINYGNNDNRGKKQDYFGNGRIKET